MQADQTKTLHAHSAPFPPILLSEADKRALRQQTYDFLDQGVKEYDRYVQTRKLPEEHSWKLLRERGDFRMYLRETSPDALIPGGATPLVGIGTVPGSLTDCMYGASTPTSDDVRIRNAYMQEQIFSFARLASLEEPTADSPFQCMNITWFVKMLPFPARIFAKHRDTVSIEATGMTTDGDGVPIAYHLGHSIDLPECAPLKEYQRVDVSALTFWRAHSANRTEIYIRTFTNLQQNKMAKVALRSFADTMLASDMYAQAGHHRKLAWLLRHPSSSIIEHARARSPKTTGFPATDANCGTCGKDLENRFSRRSGSQRSQQACALCVLPLCSTCELKKTVHSIACSTNVLGSCSVRVCPACWELVVAANTIEIAAEEVLDRMDSNRERHDSLPLLLYESKTRSAGTEVSDSVMGKTWST